jgi:methylenetetrahydrofolate reductase (NADPH)
VQVEQIYEQMKHPVVSFEFFPPRDEKARSAFDTVVEELAPLSPDYVSVTFGAGGSTKDGSYQTVKHLAADVNLPVVAYLAGYGLAPDTISGALDRYQAIGIETIFAIRGDQPREPDFAPHPDSFRYASDLIAFISGHYDFSLGCAGYPEGHVQAESLEKDIAYLKLKVNNGARYVVTQYFYDNAFYFDYVKKCRAAGITVPIVPGVMPVYTVKMTRMLSKVCGSSIPASMETVLASLADAPPDAAVDFGIEKAVEQCRGLLQQGVPGLHFYTMDRSRSTREIITRLRHEGLL